MVSWCWRESFGVAFDLISLRGENSLCMRIESDDSSIRTLDAINSANRKIYSDSKIISSNSNEKDDLLMIPNG